VYQTPKPSRLVSRPGPHRLSANPGM
jgi:hypothetical protein